MKKSIGLLLLFCLQSTIAQDIPLDPALKYGKLENGLTYYIRHNEEPKERASFYIAQNVGAILEEDNQNGLAHFLEHMAFNGTESFPNKGIIDYLEKYGVAFGRNINAYTATDETVYNISNVPVQNSTVLDSCLLILHDWTNYLLLAEEEIDAERGVISEEWRTRRTSNFRIGSKTREGLFADSKYSKRDVIGDLNIIKNFDYEILRNFYHDWYRTDLQAIIIVGDIDVDIIEKKVKGLFSGIPAVPTPKERVNFEIPDNKEPRYVLATDKEATSSYINLQFKHDNVKPENKDISYLRSNYAKSLFSSIIKSRISEKLQEENPPFISAQVYSYIFGRSKDINGLYVSVKEDQWENALREALKIVENAKDFGLLDSELKRAKINLYRSVENAYKNREKKTNDTYARQYKDHYMKNEPVPGIEYKLDLVKKILPEITLAEVNDYTKLLLTDKNFLITVSGPEKADAIYPTKEEILKVIEEVKIEELEAYRDNFKEKALVPNMPKAGKIVETNDLPELDAKELVLSNGIKVYLKHSDLNKEKILFTAQSWGGSSKLEECQVPNIMLFSDFINSFGLGEFSSVELKKALTGKIASVSPNISSLTESLSGSSSPDDMETMFQLLYLHFKQPRFDEKAFNALKTRYQAYVKNLKNDINKAFNDSVSVTMANHHPRVRPFGEKIIDEISFNGIKEIYLDRFNDPGDFALVFSGNFDEEKMTDYIKTYVASLPVLNTNESYEDLGIRPPEEEVNNHFSKEMTTNKSTVYVNLHNGFNYSEENNIYMYIISQLLSKRYLEEIREKEGGTYGVGVRSVTKIRPTEEVQLSLKFDCDPEKADKLKGIALNEIKSLLNGKVIEEDLEEVKKNLMKVRNEQIEKLSFWHSSLINYVKENKFKMNTEEYLEFVKSTDTNTIIKKANEFLKDAVKIEVIMTAE